MFSERGIRKFFKDIQIVAIKLLEIEKKMQSMDLIKNSNELEVL